MEPESGESLQRARLKGDFRRGPSPVLDELFRECLSCGGDAPNMSSRDMETPVDCVLTPFPNLKGGDWLSGAGLGRPNGAT